MPPVQVPFDAEVVDPPACPTDLICLTPKGEAAIEVNLKKLRAYAQHVWMLCGPRGATAPPSP
jgi:hypothetical protein